MPDIIEISDSVIIEVQQHAKSRIISETSTIISETLQAYKNDQALIPAPPPEVPTPQNIIGFRQRALRPLRRPPRAMLIEAQLTNLAITPLKLSDGINNKAIAWIRPRDSQNVALSQLAIEKPVSLSLAYSAIKMQPEPMIIKSRLALLSLPKMWATARLKTRPETQTISALKAVNFEKMYKLTRIMKIAMLAQSL